MDNIDENYTLKRTERITRKNNYNYLSPCIVYILIFIVIIESILLFKYYTSNENDVTKLLSEIKLLKEEKNEKIQKIIELQNNNINIEEKNKQLELDLNFIEKTYKEYKERFFNIKSDFNKYKFKNKKIKKENEIFWEYIINLPYNSKEQQDIFIRLTKSYCEEHGTNYDDNKIISFSDKLHWLNIHDSSDLKMRCTDKLLLREYVKEKLGKNICVEILKIFEDENNIDFNELPNEFVLKCNTGSRNNLIVKNKSNLNIEEAKYKISKWKNNNNGKTLYEFYYIKIKPKIFAENYIGDNFYNFKFYCFHGVPGFIDVSKKVNSLGEKISYRGLYYTNWTYINDNCLFNTKCTNFFPIKPFKLDEMVKYAKILSEDFKFVRVDFYLNQNNIILNELTFCPRSGFFIFNNKTYDKIYSDLIHIY